jgi:hypothetical protein
LIRDPKAPSSAGIKVMAASMSSSTTTRLDSPIERRKSSGKTSRPASDAATVAPENATVRPAVAIVATTAPSTSPPCARSSRKRDTISSA